MLVSAFFIDFFDRSNVISSLTTSVLILTGCSLIVAGMVTFSIDATFQPSPNLKFVDKQADKNNILCKKLYCNSLSWLKHMNGTNTAYWRHCIVNKTKNLKKSNPFLCHFKRSLLNSKQIKTMPCRKALNWIQSYAIITICCWISAIIIKTQYY